MFVYVTVVLGAMQVGLATEQLQGNAAFQRACYGVAVLAMVGVAGMVAAMVAVWVGLFAFHFLTTVDFKRREERKRGGGAVDRVTGQRKIQEV